MYMYPQPSTLNFFDVSTCLFFLFAWPRQHSHSHTGRPRVNQSRSLKRQSSEASVNSKRSKADSVVPVEDEDGDTFVEPNSCVLDSAPASAKRQAKTASVLDCAPASAKRQEKTASVFDSAPASAKRHKKALAPTTVIGVVKPTKSV